MADSPDTNATIEALQRQVDSLQTQLDALKADAAQSTAPMVDVVEPVPTAQISTAEIPTVEPRETDRRSLLRTAGAATAGAIAGAIALNATPAAAANGDPILAGATTTSTSTTTLSYTAAGAANVLNVHDGIVPAISGNAAVAGGASGQARTGVFGTSNQANGFGVQGVGSTASAIGVAATGGRANMRLVPGGTSPRTRSDAHSVGEIVVDSTGEAWLCVFTGSPGQWRRIGSQKTAGQLQLLSAPVRVFDSRPDLVPAGGKGIFNSGDQRLIDAKNNFSGVPNAAIAVLMTLTATNTNSGGFLAVFANGLTWTGFSSLNWAQKSTTVATTTVSAVDTSSRFIIRCESGGQPGCDAIVDVIGFYL